MCRHMYVCLTCGNNNEGFEFLTLLTFESTKVLHSSWPSFRSYIMLVFPIHREITLSCKGLRLEFTLFLTVHILHISFTYLSKLFFNKFIKWSETGHRSLPRALLSAHRFPLPAHTTAAFP